MPDLTFNHSDLWFIKTRGPDDKRPATSWGGYSQDFADAENVYSHEDVIKFPTSNFAVVGVQDPPHTTWSLLIFDLDIHKAADFDPNTITIDDESIPLVKSQNGGLHAYAIVHGERGGSNENDFSVPHDLDWDVDIRGSHVQHHVVAPNDIPGVQTPYRVVNDTDIPVFFDPADLCQRIRYEGEPLVEHDPSGRTTAGSIDFERPDEEPDQFPTCYANALALRKAAPDDPDYNPHQVNVLAAMCGLASGYSVEQMGGHFCELYPPNGEQCEVDTEKTAYQLEHIEEKMDRGEYSPPSIQTLQNAGILYVKEDCDCQIPYHGSDGDADGLTDRQTWEWWADARRDGQLGADPIVPDQALRYIVGEHTEYDLDALPDEVEGLPWLAVWKGLNWLRYQWGPAELDIDPHDDEDHREVTARDYPSPDEDDVHHWEGVRRIYKELTKEQGRYAAVRLLRRDHEFLTPEDTEELHVYVPDLGIYQQGARYDIGRTLDRNLDSYYSTHEKNEILNRLREVTVDREELEANRMDGTYICVENGVLDIDSRELLEHDPKWLFTKRLDVEYHPDAGCPRTREFLEDITRREADWMTLIEMLGNALLPNYNFESFLVLFGRGSNGKSTWYNVVREFLGSDNVENIPLHTLTDDKFAASQLLGKWANIGGDLPETKINDLGTIKDLTGGGDVWAQQKGKDGFNFSNRAKMMFAANQPPVLGERSHAIARRILPIRLPNRYTPHDDDHKDRINDLEDKLTTDEELSGLLNAALDGIDRLREHGDFSLPEKPQERLEYYEQFSDHIKMFSVNCLENRAGDQELKDDVYNAYTDYCEQKGRSPSTKQSFWRQIRRTTMDIQEIRPHNEQGQRERRLDNLTFTDHGRQFAPNYETDDYDVPKLSEIAAGDEHITVEGRIAQVSRDQPDAVAEKATLVDVTDSVTVTVWSDSNKPQLEPEQPYRFKSVNVTEYEGDVEIQVDRNSGIEELSDGVGNVPAADPGENEQLDATADGGAATPSATTEREDTELEQLKPLIVKFVGEQRREYDGGVPHALVVGEFVTRGHSPDAVEDAISRAKTEDGTLHEPKSDHYRRT